jgi:hypothetical protein
MKDKATQESEKIVQSALGGKNVLDLTIQEVESIFLSLLNGNGPLVALSTSNQEKEKMLCREIIAELSHKMIGTAITEKIACIPNANELVLQILNEKFSFTLDIISISTLEASNADENVKQIIRDKKIGIFLEESINNLYKALEHELTHQNPIGNFISPIVNKFDTINCSLVSCPHF